MAETDRVLVIDDDAAFRFAMVKALSRHGFSVSEADGGERALEILAGAQPPDAALLDLRMGGIDGIEVLKRSPSVATRMIVLTGHGSVEAAVQAMRLGAFSFLEKPVDAEVLAPMLTDAAAESRRARLGLARLDVPPLVGASRAMEEVREFVARAGPSEEIVALYGETGTGKEVVAHHLHLASPRSDGPFVALNAATVQRDLFESELFGHRKGAFTGATVNHQGMFGEAEGGTLFIDEVAELPSDTQAKLLRALESRRVRPLGATREVDVDVRIIAATNRDLWSEVQAGSFREDLYFRLQVLPLELPPLRARQDDILPLTSHLLERIGRTETCIDDGGRQLMLAYEWPGNVRELLNVLRRAVIFADGPALDADLMRRMLAASVFGHGVSAVRDDKPASEGPTSLAEVERAHIERVLASVGGNVTRAASALGIDRRTLQRKLRGFE